MQNDPLAPGDELENQIVGHGPRLKAFLIRLAPKAGEDLLQEVMARALRYKRSYDPEGSLFGWLKRTAYRVYLDHLKKEKSQPRLLGDRIWDLPAKGEGRAENREYALSLLRELNPKEKKVFTRFHIREQSIREISLALGLAQGTVKSHLHRARKKLAFGRREE